MAISNSKNNKPDKIKEQLATRFQVKGSLFVRG